MKQESRDFSRERFKPKFSYILILLVGCFFVKNEIVVLGSVIAMMGYSSLFDRICNDVGFVIRKTPIMQNSCERISFFYINEEEAKGKKYLPQEDINVKNLSFSYGEKAIFTK